MAFIDLIADEAATGPAATIYAEARAAMGYVPNYARAFASQPDVYLAWQQLNRTIRSAGDLRRFELATLAAARKLRSSYCALAHGKILAEKFSDNESVRAFPRGLSPVDVAVVELAEKVVVDATSVTAADVDRLRTLGLSDDEILVVVLAAAARCFFSKTLDALGIQPDSAYGTLDPELRSALTVGRPIEGAVSA
jgi:uncharacterized peroxidase-related enzyme